MISIQDVVLWVGVISLGSLIQQRIPIIIASIASLFVWRKQALRDRYDTKWACVTGFSSGIGFSLSEKLAGQHHLNIVGFAKDDENFSPASQALKSSYPDRDFRLVPLDLGQTPSEEFMKAISKTVGDLDIGICFFNAGFCTPEPFMRSSKQYTQSMMNCHVNSVVAMARYFVDRMMKRSSSSSPSPSRTRKGGFVFTGSMCSFLPSPYAALYSGTKSFIRTFGVALRNELVPHKIDVLVIEPGPVDTNIVPPRSRNFWLRALFSTRGIRQHPSSVAETMISSLGVPGLSVVQTGSVSHFSLIFAKLVDVNVIASIFDAAIWVGLRAKFIPS